MIKSFIPFFCMVLFASCSKKVLPESTSINKLASFSIINNSKYLIVFECGLGDNHKVWNRTNIPTTISAREDIVTYDRAGYGKSPKASNPRNIENLSIDLDSVINQYANGRKIILVGHSIGGMIIRDYAIKHPTKIAGLLFIDPSHESFNFPTQTQENLIKLLVGINSAGAKMEAMQLIEDANYMATLPGLPNVPVIVLTSMKHDESNTKSDEAFNKTRKDWFNAHESLGKGIIDFTHISTTKSGHYIFNEEPNLVLENLNLLISKLP